MEIIIQTEVCSSIVNILKICINTQNEIRSNILVTVMPICTWVKNKSIIISFHVIVNSYIHFIDMRSTSKNIERDTSKKQIVLKEHTCI